MYSRVCKYLLVIFLSAHVAAASEKSAEAAGGEEHGEAKSAAEKNEGGSANKEKSKYEAYSAVLLRVNTLFAKVRAGEEEIKRLIIEKQETKDPKRVTEIVQQMIKVHKELEENAKEYTQQKALLNYSYPEKGMHEKRKYERVEVRSIEEMEGQFNLTTGIKRTMDKARIQYESPEARSQKNKSKGESSVIKNETQDTIAPSLLEPVIIKK